MTPLLESNCPKLKLIARGKVRDLYDIDQDSLLFVATDRISAYDCIMYIPCHKSLLKYVGKQEFLQKERF